MGSGEEFGLGGGLGGRLGQGVAPGKAGDPHAQQADAPLQRHAPGALAGGPADPSGVAGGGGERLVAGDGVEVVEAQLEADRLPHVALARQVVGELLA